MDFYEEYKPFRYYMRRFSLVDSLIDIWRYSLHILDNTPLPPDYAIGKPPLEEIRENIWPWDLDILSREIVLNASTRGDRNLRRWNDIAGAINHIRRLDNDAFAIWGEHPDVLFELHTKVSSEQNGESDGRPAHLDGLGPDRVNLGQRPRLAIAADLVQPESACRIDLDQAFIAGHFH
jgi:hypothetical protein